MRRLRFPGDLDAAGFLAGYWQKQPLLMRSAFDPRVFDLSGDELAGLALDSDVEARLITQDRDGVPQLAEPPFAAEDFTCLPPTGWTLLVQDVDKHLPELAEFLEAVDFIPSWRLDDLMVSVSAPEGGVGPHVDQYDVFLCQMTGRKRWQLANPQSRNLSTTGPLRQLTQFAATESFELDPGDVLYLPPGIPHDGVSMSHGSTWSVGFRAPSLGDLQTALPGLVVSPSAAEQRYCDPDLEPEESDAGLIGPLAMHRFRRLLGPAGHFDDEKLLRSLGEFLTTPKPWLQAEACESPLKPGRLAKKLTGGERLVRHGMALFARAQQHGSHYFFASGQSWRLPESLGDLARTLCRLRQVSLADSGVKNNSHSLELLVTLYNEGQLLLESELHEL